MKEKLDPNHNEFFNSEELMWANYEKEMERQGIKLPPGGVPGSKFQTASSEVTGDEFFITEPTGRARKRNGQPEDDSGLSVQASHVESGLSEIKSRAIRLFEAHSSDGRISNDVEEIIRSIERLEKTCGIRSGKFEPLRHMSGLKVGEPLENANRVVDNTMANYDMYLIDSIESRMVGGRPSVTVSIVGEKGGRGFVARSIISSDRDFSGSEAVDYVHASPKGLFSVKRFERDRWVDASSDFLIKMKVSEFDMESNKKMPHTVFVGEKIASSGKDMIKKGLNLSDEDVVFGKNQIFASNEKTIKSVVEFIKGNIGG